MDKDKAIQLLERLQDPEPYEPMLTKDAYDAIQMAIDALSADGDTISRKAAIDAINHELRCGAVIDQCGLETAHDLIEELPPVQPEQLGTNLAEVGTDCISRQAAIDALTEYGNGRAVFISVGEAVIRIEQLPPAQSERIKARWLPIGIADAVGGESAMWGDEIAYHACDNCWQQALEKDGEEILSDFCPHCGAEMKGEQE